MATEGELKALRGILADAETQEAAMEAQIAALTRELRLAEATLREVRLLHETGLVVIKDKDHEIARLRNINGELALKMAGLTQGDWKQRLTAAIEMHKREIARLCEIIDLWKQLDKQHRALDEVRLNESAKLRDERDEAFRHHREFAEASQTTNREFQRDQDMLKLQLRNTKDAYAELDEYHKRRVMDLERTLAEANETIHDYQKKREADLECIRTLEGVIAEAVKEEE